MKDTHSSAESSDSEDEEYIEGRDDESEEELEELENSTSQPSNLSLMKNGISQDTIPEEDSQTSNPVRKTSHPPLGSSLDQNHVDTKITSSKSFDCLSAASEKEGKVDVKGKEDTRSRIKKHSAFSFDLNYKKTSKGNKIDNRKFSTESDPGVSTEYQRTQQPRLSRQGAIKASRRNRDEAPQATSPSQDKWATKRYVIVTVLYLHQLRLGISIITISGWCMQHTGIGWIESCSLRS